MPLRASPCRPHYRRLHLSYLLLCEEGNARDNVRIAACTWPSMLSNSEVRHLSGVTGLTANSYSSRVRNEALSGSQ